MIFVSHHVKNNYTTLQRMPIPGAMVRGRGGSCFQGMVGLGFQVSPVEYNGKVLGSGRSDNVVKVSEHAPADAGSLSRSQCHSRDRSCRCATGCRNCCNGVMVVCVRMYMCVRVYVCVHVNQSVCLRQTAVRVLACRYVGLNPNVHVHFYIDVTTTSVL